MRSLVIALLLTFSCLSACEWHHVSDPIPENSFDKRRLFLDMSNIPRIGRAVSYPYRDDFISRPEANSYVIFLREDNHMTFLAQWWLDIPTNPWIKDR